jgi:hypothetical protein
MQANPYDLSLPHIFILIALLGCHIVKDAEFSLLHICKGLSFINFKLKWNLKNILNGNKTVLIIIVFVCVCGFSWGEVNWAFIQIRARARVGVCVCIYLADMQLTIHCVFLNIYML